MRKYLYNLATDKYRGLLPGLIKGCLFLLSLAYGVIVRFLAATARKRVLNCRVISVGNITLGGTGKTTLVELTARHLKQSGHKVAILTRGYKRQVASQEGMGDEPYMLQVNLGDIPVIVGSDRIRSGNQAITEYGADTLILDDGFQQWGLKKDLEIVTIDATNPFGNRRMIPRGLLREPLGALKRADIFVLSKTNLNPDYRDVADFLSRINPSTLIVESAHLPLGFYEWGREKDLCGADTFKDKSVALVSGIGDPASFENLISGMGLKIGLSLRFPDHYNYSSRDARNIARAVQDKDIDTVITTEKDAVRIHALRALEEGLRIFVLRIEMRITKNEEGFLDRLLKLYRL